MARNSRGGRWLGRVVGMLTVTAALLSTGSLAAAQPSAADKQRAGELMVSGDQQAAEGRLEQALTSYMQADAIMGVPTTGLAVARVLERMGRLVQARDAALRVTQMPSAPDEAEPLKDARVDAAKLLGALEQRLPALVLVLAAPPEANASVTLDGVQVPPAQLGVEQKVNPGSHRVEIRAAGHEPSRQDLVLGEGERRRLDLALGAASLAPGPAPVGPEPAPAGAGQTGDGPTPLLWVGLAVGGAGIVVGAITGIVAWTKSGDLEDSCGGVVCPPAYEDELDRATTLAWTSNVSFGIGLLGIAVGLTAFGIDEASNDGPTSGEAPVVRPLIGAGYAGLDGRF